MLAISVIISVLCFHGALGQFGPFAQNFSYVDVRPGAHMFYWLFYTTAEVSSYNERPLIVWLQGGPGGSSTGIGNFEIMGPWDLSLQERDYTWIKEFNVLYVDNPVGTGYSYVDEASLFTTSNEEIADDFVNLMRGFLANHPEFEGVPLYIYGQSYGGKMAVDMGIKMHEAEQAGTINSSIRGIAMGNAWIHPVDLTLTWGPLLLAAGLVDDAGYENIQAAAREAERLYNEGQYVASTNAWAQTQGAVFAGTGSVDFYNILTKMSINLPETTSQMSEYEFARYLAIHDGHLPRNTRNDEWNTYELMNGPVKEALGIPENVVWGSQSGLVFDVLRGDFMKPVTEGIEKLLNETNIIVQKYNGNLDLICDTPAAREAERLYNEGQYVASTNAWAQTQGAVFAGTGSVDFYNILTKMSINLPETTSQMSEYEFARYLAIHDGHLPRNTRNDEWNTYELMNGPVKEALGIPENVVWGSQSGLVFDVLRGDFMKPVTEGIEKLLNETNIIVQKYNGNLDLICDTPGQLLWMDRLSWDGADAYKDSPRLPIWEDSQLEGYYKAYGNLRFFWINVAGHSVPRDNPAGSRAFLRDMTSFG